MFQFVKVRDEMNNLKIELPAKLEFKDWEAKI